MDKFDKLSNEDKIRLTRKCVDWYNEQGFDNYYANFSKIKINLDLE